MIRIVFLTVLQVLVMTNTGYYKYLLLPSTATTCITSPHTDAKCQLTNFTSYLHMGLSIKFGNRGPAKTASLHFKCKILCQVGNSIFFSNIR